MSKMGNLKMPVKKVCSVLASVLLCFGNMPAASAGFGTGIGISLPMGSSAAKSSDDRENYAIFNDGTLMQELTVKEKNGRLILELRLTNISGTIYTVENHTGQKYDFEITGKGGETLYRWSDGMVFTQALNTVSYEPGKPVVYTAEIERKDYRAIKKNAFLVSARLSDTPYTIAVKLPSVSAAGTSPAVLHGGIIIGNGRGDW